MILLKKTCLIAIFSFVQISVAQDANVMNQGTIFGNSIAPTQAGQIVNPGVVNLNAWGNNTSAPLSTPNGLGGFSTPHTQGTDLEQAKTIGLAGLGNAAMDRCASYVPTGDPAKDQECAAVNFLSQRCLTPSAGQAQIMSKAGAGSNQAQLLSSYCAGSYGKGADQFNFKDQVTAGDSVFSSITGAQNKVGTKTGQICTQKKIVVEPALYETSTCLKSINTDQISCSQFLRIEAIQEPGCSPGQFLTRVIADPCPTCPDKLVFDFTCTATGYNMHVFSIYKSNGALNEELGSRDISGRVGFATPRTLGPHERSQGRRGKCYETHYTQACTSTTCSITTEFHNPCHNTRYAGTNHFAIPMIEKYVSRWDNQCSTLEQNAGISLGEP